MRAIDANVLVRLIARDDPGQTAYAETFVSPGAWVSTLALAEASWVLSSVYHLTPANLAKAIEMLLNHRDLVLDQPSAVAAALELYRARPAIPFSDCLMFQLAREAGHLPFGAFDRNFEKLEGAQKL
jgi:predicted nucleic-acid-binding protein